MMLLLAVLSFSGTVVAQAPEQAAQAPKSYQVEKIALGTGVESRELVGEATAFDVSVRRVYCWTKISSQNVPATIKHVWYAGDETAADVPLDIKYPTTRTWSSKVIWAGKWRVEVVSETGEVLASTDFTVTAQPGPSGP
jgi:nitrogen fixation protein FixH